VSSVSLPENKESEKYPQKVLRDSKVVQKMNKFYTF